MAKRNDGATSKKKILLIEDEDVILELLRGRLIAAGYEVATAADGVSGLALIRETRPDLVLLDMLLPGLSGFKILEKMKEEGLLPATPVLILSNSGQPIELERALQMGVRDALIKVNFDPHEVLMRVENILRAEGRTEAPAGVGVKTPSPSLAKGWAGRTILIVEDDFLLVGLLERKFLEEGYRVVKAVDAGEARRALETGGIDAVLLDMVLPGMDGFSFLEEMKRNAAWRTIPVAVISNLGQQEEVEKGIRMGAAEYLIKANISPADIVQKVEEMLKNHKAQ